MLTDVDWKNARLPMSLIACSLPGQPKWARAFSWPFRASRVSLSLSLSLCAFAGLSWCLIAPGLSRPIVASPGLAWPRLASRGLTWPPLASPGLSWPLVASPGPKMAPRWPKIAPRWPHDGSKTAQDGLQSGHDGPKMAPRNLAGKAPQNDCGKYSCDG